jgi:fucose permease
VGKGDERNASEKKSTRKIVLTAIFHVVVLFVIAQLSTFISNKLDAIGLKVAIIFLICAFVVYGVATLIVDYLIPAVRKSLQSKMVWIKMQFEGRLSN